MRRLALCALLLPALAQAQYNYLPFKMLSSQQRPFPYYVDMRLSAPAGLASGQMLVAADSAWGTWNAVQCASPKVVSRGSTQGFVPRPADPYDAFSVAPVWLVTEDADWNAVVGSRWITAITLPLSYAGVLSTCDAYFNGANHQWSLQAVTPSGYLDFQTVMLHEAGHCFGLDHYGNAGDLMGAVVVPGLNQRALTSNDAQGLCLRYPTSGTAGSPCLGDGGCGTTTLKCLSQTTASGPLSMCVNGCTVNSGTVCEVPLSCQASSAFAPMDGACLLPGLAITQVGKPCTGGVECGSGLSLCQVPEAAPSGYQFWANGYCTQACEVGQPPCPAGSTCTLMTDNTRRCLKSCRVGLADCRPEYTCLAVTGGGVCIPRCYTNPDCGSASYQCRTCDGLCVAIQSPTGQVGDVCTQDASCGAGQICLATDARSSTRSCTRQCGRGCGTCPTGSSCHPLALGDLYCLRDCTGPGTCPGGMRCADFTTGKACMPACQRTTDCPVGLDCVAGECTNSGPIDDGGTCGTLCNVPDGGKPTTPPKPDAGTGGGGGTGGCGCQSSSSPSLALFALLGLLVLSRWRIAWRR